MATVLSDTLLALVQNISKENGLYHYEIDAKPMDASGSNYMGNIIFIDVSENDTTLSAIAKMTNTSEEARKFVQAGEFYKRETFVYTELTKIYRDIETKHAVPEELRYKFVKFYGAETKELEEAIVLENLCKKGYVVADRRECMSWDYAKAGVEELAKYHALSYAFEREDPEKFEELIKSKKNMLSKPKNGDKDETGERYMKKVLGSLFNVLEAKYVPIVQKFCAGALEEYYRWNLEPTEHSVLTHSDYRISNILVKYEEGAITDLIPIDYQLIFHGSPINDLLYFLFTGTDQQFRKRHYESYIQHYYDSLARALQRFNLDIDDVYPRSIFYHHLREKLLLGITTAVFVLPIVLVTAGEQIEINNLLSEKTDMSMSRNSLYKDRVNGIVEDLLRWGVLEE